MSVVASRITPNQGGRGELGRTHERVDRSSTHPHEDFPRPHVLLPNPILLVWRIEENRIGNHPLIIVNALTIWLPLPEISGSSNGMRHSAANNAAGLGPVEGNSA